MKHYYNSGIVLVTSLILLVVITTLVLFMVRSVVSQEKVSSNYVEKSISFQLAESGLRVGEQWLMQLTTVPIANTSCSAVPCVLKQATFTSTAMTQNSWWTSNSKQITDTNITSKHHAKPSYITEARKFVPDNSTVGKGVPTGLYYYNVTAKGSNNNGTTSAVIQSTIVRRY